MLILKAVMQLRKGAAAMGVIVNIKGLTLGCAKLLNESMLALS